MHEVAKNLPIHAKGMSLQMLVILILEANLRQFTVHTSLLISCDIFKKNAISIFIRYFENDPIIA